MPRARTCAICKGSLEGKHPLAKTCSRACKEKLARQNKADEKRRARARERQKRSGLEKLAEATAGGPAAIEVAREVLRDELRSYISREALTEDVLQDIKEMINYAPAAIQVLTLQLASEDETVAQRAAALILKYTMGNPSVAPASAEQQPAPMQVHFNMPERQAQPELEGTDVETRTCSACGVSKAEDAFVGKSNRCLACFERMQSEVAERFTKSDPTRPA